MDLGTISRKLERNKYSSPPEVFADLRLVWSNCKVFNEEGSEVYTGCIELEKLVNQWWQQAGLPYLPQNASASGAQLPQQSAQAMQAMLTQQQHQYPVGSWQHQQLMQQMHSAGMYAGMGMPGVRPVIANAIQTYACKGAHVGQAAKHAGVNGLKAQLS